MKRSAKEQIKSMLALRGMTITKLAEILSEHAGKKYTLASVSNKLSRGTMPYSEVQMIAELLGFEIIFNDTSK